MVARVYAVKIRPDDHIERARTRISCAIPEEPHAYDMMKNPNGRIGYPF